MLELDPLLFPEHFVRIAKASSRVPPAIWGRGRSSQRVRDQRSHDAHRECTDSAKVGRSWLRIVDSPSNRQFARLRTQNRCWTGTASGLSARSPRRSLIQKLENAPCG